MYFQNMKSKDASIYLDPYPQVVLVNTMESG